MDLRAFLKEMFMKKSSHLIINNTIQKRFQIFQLAHMTTAHKYIILDPGFTHHFSLGMMIF
jgi:hypothetical protein